MGRRRGAPARPIGAGADRQELLKLLLTDGILHRTETQPVLGRDGTPARWMLDSLSVTLTPRGAELAAHGLLDELASFTGRQLATYGLTGVPLLQGCLLQGQGRYSGILVRKERKAHGSLKLIEGRLDRSEPVVIVDDSVSSGLSMAACADALEAAGFQVEGGVCLVRFDYGRGVLRMVERGYRMAAVFDIYTDFMSAMVDEEPILANPTKRFGPLNPAPRRAPDGVHPAELAREVIGEYLERQLVVGAPARLDRAYDSSGGCWVSLRRRSDIYDRPARNGFWHFPDERPAPAAEDVVLASVRTAQELMEGGKDAAATLADCAVGVTFFSALEECAVGELDNDRYGIVVRSGERPWCMGGALPRMPGILNEWQQFAHARITNARLSPLEPYRLYRHEVHKVISPGDRWQPTGVPAPKAQPWNQRKLVVGPWAERARASVLEALGGPPARAAPATTAAPPPHQDGDVVFVTVYSHGRLAGCMGGPAGDLATTLPAYARAAATDGRFVPIADHDRLAVSVSWLFNRHEIGVADPAWVVRPFRFAQQALEVSQGQRRGLLLPFLAVMHNLTPLQYVYEVIDKAGITRPPYRWTRYDCATWLADATGTSRLVHGLPAGRAAASGGDQLERLWPIMVGYARRHHVARGVPAGRYEVFANRVRTGLAPARLAYGAWVMAKVGLRREAAVDLRRLQRGLRRDGWIVLDDAPSLSELAFFLLAQLELGSAPFPRSPVADALWGRIDEHGRFTTHREKVAASDSFQDYCPGQALLALAAAAECGAAPVDHEALRRSSRFYRMRFQHNHHWGAVTWLIQAFAAWGRVESDRSLTAFAYEIADWALQFQSRKSGGFLNDHQSDSPGATTALYLEGLAAAADAAGREGNGARQRRYRAACARGLQFLDGLVYQERDRPVLPNPEWAIGGLRTSLTASDVRIDYVMHALAAMHTMRETAPRSAGS
ncbi:MAG: AMMECR1 domain-containing protein [Actinomycetota bacterium]|nr:AMMECR1 domain-containing protein [Actinomycetota bacterium]